MTLAHTLIMMGFPLLTWFLTLVPSPTEQFVEKETGYVRGPWQLESRAGYAGHGPHLEG